jgi:hypothetical protein
MSKGRKKITKFYVMKDKSNIMSELNVLLKVHRSISV